MRLSSVEIFKCRFRGELMAVFKHLERKLNRLYDSAFRKLWGDPETRISPTQKCKFEERLSDKEKRLLSVFATKEIQKEFPKEQELKEKLEKLDTINTELKINDNDHEMLGDEQEEREEKQTNKKSPERC